MGVYLLNISVDAADPNPEHIPEDLTINDQESIVEMVVEQVLGCEDAIKEYDDHDTEDHNKKKTVKIDLLVQVINAKNDDHNQAIKRNKLHAHHEVRLTSGFIEIDSPPPKV